MADVDHLLIYQTRKFINGANVHRIKTWIFCYETLQPSSVRREQYEKLLREFVRSNQLLIATRMR